MVDNSTKIELKIGKEDSIFGQEGKLKDTSMGRAGNFSEKYQFFHVRNDFLKKNSNFIKN